ncbi:MAG: SRPBCC domain-containing protein [Actinobacteria bacterium]|nr:SRPBCC domain-containing protein [Actinomycetota bacterium]
MTPPQIDFSRTFNAPRDLVYRAFTDPDHFTVWWGPSGNTVPRDEVDFDIRTGGYQRWTEVAANDPTVRVQVHVDLNQVSDGRLLAGVMHVNGELPDGIAPFETAFRIEFHEESPTRTRLQVRQWLPANLTSPSEQGWKQAFTKLDAILAKIQIPSSNERN